MIQVLLILIDWVFFSLQILKNKLNTSSVENTRSRQENTQLLHTLKHPRAFQVGLAHHQRDSFKSPVCHDMSTLFSIFSLKILNLVSSVARYYVTANSPHTCLETTCQKQSIIGKIRWHLMSKQNIFTTNDSR